MKLMKRYVTESQWNEVEEIETEKEMLENVYKDVDILFEEKKEFDTFSKNQFSFRSPYALYRVCP